MKKYTIIVFSFFLFFLHAKEVNSVANYEILNKIILPKNQIKIFPINKSFLYAMSETISGNYKYLVVGYSFEQNNQAIEKMIAFLNESKITFEKMQRNYYYTKPKNSSEAFAVAYKMQSLGLSVLMGKNLIPYEAVGDWAEGSYFSKISIDKIFNDEIQDAYLVSKIQNDAAAAMYAKRYIETVIETYATYDLHIRGFSDAIMPMREFTEEETGTQYALAYQGAYGSIFIYDNRDIVPNARYDNVSFFQTFQNNYKKLFGKKFSLEDARAEITISPLNLKSNEEYLKYFNVCFASDSYYESELKHTINSKGITIFCVDSKRDRNKICKTKEELKKHLKLQNSTLY
jgi:hypothetical protein